MKTNNYNGVLQEKLNTGFNAASTASDVSKGIDLTDKVAIVTGGNTGIGLETVKTLSEAGATVIVLARNIEKARQNLQNIKNVEIEEMDLIDSDSIRRFTDKFLTSGRQLNLLINNAGIMFVPLRRDKQGIESQLATNYLAVFQLTANLMPALKKAQGARVINVSSQGHQFSPFNFEDPNFEKREYETLAAYGQSKTAINLFSLELDNLAKSSGIRAYAVHPGNIWGTELLREAPLEMLQNFGFYDEQGNPVQKVIASLKTIPQGAATTIWTATSPLLNNIGGVYCEDSDIAELALGQEMEAGVKPYSLDEKSAKRLWRLTQELTGIVFEV